MDADTTIDVVLDGVKVTGTITGPGGDPLYHIRIEAVGEDYLGSLHGSGRRLHDVRPTGGLRLPRATMGL